MASSTRDVNQYPVHLGIWTNWSRGHILGPTVTLRRQDANLLIAFTAFYIAFVATRFWRIICFAFHRQYATTTSQNAIYHQRQAILRNSATPEGGILQLARLIWANRDRKGRFAPLFVAIVAAVSVTVFTVAGGLSSQISSAVGTEVLIQSLNCGYRSNSVADGQISAFASNQAENINNAANYAQQCYSNYTAGILDCGLFVSKKIESKIDYNATCPFQENICQSRSKNVRIDSGYINSHEDLGLNYPVEERVLFRNVLHCAPITTAGFTTQLNNSVGNLTLYKYGSILSPSGPTDYVFAAESIESQYKYTFSPNIVASVGDYELSPHYAYIKNRTVASSSDFIPIDPIFREDSNVMLIFLSGKGVVYLKPSTDEWYRISPSNSSVPVTVSGGGSGSSNITVEFHLPLEPASPLGCADQYQFCRADIQHCGPLASFDDAVSGAAHFFNTTYSDFLDNNAGSTSANQFNYFVATVAYNQFVTIAQVIGRLGADSLASKSSLTFGVQGPLPSNQWQLDVIHLSDITKATLQAAFLNTAYFNPPDISQIKLRTAFKGPDSTKLCNNQKIRTTAYASFSLFGLLFVFIVGALIVLTSFLLEPVSEQLYKKRGFMTYAHLEWTNTATLQLQRLAHEQVGFGSWSKGTAEVPITEAGDLLGCLDISNLDHPLLCSPHKEGDLRRHSPVARLSGESYQLPYSHHANSSSSDRHNLDLREFQCQDSSEPIAENLLENPLIPEAVRLVIDHNIEAGETKPEPLGRHSTRTTV